MRRPRVVAVGELLWDLLPEGKQLGGAPGNVVHHARQLGADATLITRVGRDPLGREAGQNLVEVLSSDPVRPTGTATVALDANGQPRFQLAEDVAWDYIELDEAARGLAARADAIYFGTLAQRAPVSRRSIRELLAAAPQRALRVLDLNLRDPYWSPELVEQSLGAATVLKLSDGELARLPLEGGVRERIAQLARRFDLDLVALTRGPQGSLLYRAGDWVEHPGVPVTVRDAIGAGDAFTAALVVGLLRGVPLDVLSDRANRIGAYVCTQPGATPRLPQDLLYNDPP